MAKKNRFKEIYASIDGVHEVTDTPHNFSPTYEVRDRNMKRHLATTFRPTKYEVPCAGTVWRIVYECEQERYITLQELADEYNKRQK